MMVYVLEVDNGMEYDDNNHWVENVFKSFRSATEFLLDKGFALYAEKDILTNEYYLCFEKEDRDKDQNVRGWISKFPLLD